MLTQRKKIPLRKTYLTGKKPGKSDDEDGGEPVLCSVTTGMVKMYLSV
jgi:hypothetical protein